MNHRVFKFLIMALLCQIFPKISSYAQTELFQNVKGYVKDQDSNFPIIGVNILVIGTDPILGSTTDMDGAFKINKVPIGRISLLITSIGYEQRVISDIVVGAGKEVVINVFMEESLVKLDEIVVTDKKNKAEVSNEMVQVSGRTFSVMETSRYAGTLNDPARAVSSFAGIQSNAEGTNHIVVRGNSPNTVQWRMEGIEIPNPNHFADEGSSGGSINILSSNVLTNSDFYTGAFTADYSNVLGGVFDMKMRSGNREKREYTVGIGILGTDLSVEGPFVKGGKSSYLANYRYSTLGLIDNLGIVDFGGVPKYQDLSFKMSFPTKNAGLFTLFGIGGLSNISDEIEAEDSNEIVGKDHYNASMGTLNLGHAYFFDNNTSLESYVSISHNGSSYELLENKNDPDRYDVTFNDRLDKLTLRVGTSLLSKINAKNTIKTGIGYQHFIFEFNQQLTNNLNILETRLQDEGDAGMVNAYTTWKHRINEKFTFTAGLNYLNFLLNNSQALEPRASLKMQIDPSQSVFAGIGLHSQIPTLPTYYALIENDNGGEDRPNLDLGLMKATHYVVGYDKMISDNLYFKAEIYYQSLNKIPVENDITSSYSILNAVDGLTNRALVNEGTGKNYGVELTLERYFNKNYYFLLTGSLYQSKYKALDGIERNNRFNGNYLANFLFGKEIYLNKSKKKLLSINNKISWSGGRRFTSVDFEESSRLGRTIYFEDNAFAQQGDDVLKWDLSISYIWNKRKTRQKINFAIQNLTNNKGKVDQYYNSFDDKLESSEQLPLFPTLMYTIQF